MIAYQVVEVPMIPERKAISMLREAIALYYPNGLQDAGESSNPIDRALTVAYQASEEFDPDPEHALEFTIGVGNVEGARRRLDRIVAAAHELSTAQEEHARVVWEYGTVAPTVKRLLPLVFEGYVQSTINAVVGVMTTLEVEMSRNIASLLDLEERLVALQKK